MNTIFETFSLLLAWPYLICTTLRLLNTILNSQTKKIPEQLLHSIFAAIFLAVNLITEGPLIPYLMYSLLFFTILSSLHLGYSIIERRRKWSRTTKEKMLVESEKEANPFQDLDEKEEKFMEVQIKVELDKTITDDGKPYAISPKLENGKSAMAFTTSPPSYAASSTLHPTPDILIPPPSLYEPPPKPGRKPRTLE